MDMPTEIESPAATLQAATTVVPESKADANPLFTNAARHLLYGAVLALVELASGRWTFWQASSACLAAADASVAHSKHASFAQLLRPSAHWAKQSFPPFSPTRRPAKSSPRYRDCTEAALSLSEWSSPQSIHRFSAARLRIQLRPIVTEPPTVV
jgi:hypothetical protein